MDTEELVTHSRSLVASAKEQLLLLRELEARDGAGDYVLLNLDEVGIGGRHSKDRVEMRIVLEKYGDTGPVVLVHADAKTLLHRGLARDHDLLLAERPEIVESASQVTIRRVYIARKGFFNWLPADEQVRGFVGGTERCDGAGQYGTRAFDQLPCGRFVHLKAIGFIGVEIAAHTLTH